MQIRSALLAATLLALPFAAQAQNAPATGLYIGGAAGVNIMQDEPINSVGNVTLNNTSVQTDVGAAAILSLGWGWGNGLRTEMQFNYRYNGLKDINGSNGNSGGCVSNGHCSGSEQKFGPMPTVFYDFNTVSPFVIPYVGVGIGYQYVEEKLDVGNSSFNKGQGAFAYQAIVGAAFPIASVPGLSVTADYRFLGVTDRTYNVESSNVKLGNDFNHAITVGLRYAFGVAPPPPPPAPMAAPAPAPARSYLVFFDWDKASLTPRAQQIIAEAAANSAKVKYTQIQVNGYTDTSGTPQYNQGLSIRRAQAVAAELVKDGVPKGAIAIQGFGETHLLVPTGPGVREPQNRRVEIIIR
jgi:OOP family OmpA-OmpF porin